MARRLACVTVRRRLLYSAPTDRELQRGVEEDGKYKAALQIMNQTLDGTGCLLCRRVLCRRVSAALATGTVL